MWNAVFYRILGKIQSNIIIAFHLIRTLAEKRFPQSIFSHCSFNTFFDLIFKAKQLFILFEKKVGKTF